MSKTQHFVDYVRLSVKAGDGGYGIIAFLREAHRPFGGPAGGDGGAGGSIILEAEAELMTLLDLKMRPRWAAENGKSGGNKNMSGRGGKDLLLKVPLGTVVTDEATGELIGELVKPGQQLIAARGGRGGLGNQHFATATNKAPRKTVPPEEGEERAIILELKVLADAGLVGLPNAGKSTLLAAMTAATPKIAAYPFTTLSPNLGVFLASDYQSRITVADIPGLIEGANQGAGLGGQFLRHIERTKILVHLVAPEGGEAPDGSITPADTDPETLLYAFDLVERELQQYSPALLEKPRIVCLSKADLFDDDTLETAKEAFRARGYEPIAISSASGQSLEELKLRIEETVLAKRADEDESIDENEDAPE